MANIYCQLVNLEPPKNTSAYPVRVLPGGFNKKRRPTLSGVALLKDGASDGAHQGEGAEHHHLFISLYLPILDAV